MHQYSFPISITLDGNARATGQFIATYDDPLDEATQETARVAIEKALNEQASNPLLPGALYTLAPARYKKLKKR